MSTHSAEELTSVPGTNGKDPKEQSGGFKTENTSEISAQVPANLSGMRACQTPKSREHIANSKDTRNLHETDYKTATHTG